MKRFIIYFRQKVKNIIDYTHENSARVLAKKIQYNTEIDKTNDILKNLKNQILPAKIMIQDEIGQAALTPREMQYLLLMLEGKSMNKIAAELKISPRTVEASLENIKLKTCSTTKAQLLANFFKKQLNLPSIYYDRYA